MTTQFTLSGRMFYPPTGMKNFSKHKPIFDKVAKYTGGSDEKYFMLMKVFTVDKSHEDNLIATYSNKFELWEVKKLYLPDLETLLRDEAIGMCDHNLEKYLETIEEANSVLEWDCKLKDLFTLSPRDSAFKTLKPANDDENYWFRRRMDCAGTCNRTECRTLSVEQLLERFIEKKIPIHDDLKNFKPIMEISGYSFDTLAQEFGVEKKPIFDYELKPGESFSVSGIKATKLRGMSNSNGKEVYEFQITVNRDSKIERAKNALRPLALKAKRGSTHRNPIIHRFAHEDKSTLKKWRDALDRSLIRVSVSEHIMEKVADLEEHLKHLKEGKFRSKNNKQNNDVSGLRVQSINDIIPVEILNDHEGKLKNIFWNKASVMFNPRAERGMDTEIVAATMELPVEILDLFSALVPMESDYKSSIAGNFTKSPYFENFLFGYNHNLMNQGMFYNIDPPMRYGGWSEKFGQHLQSILILSQRKEKIPCYYDSGGIVNFVRDAFSDIFSYPSSLKAYLVNSDQSCFGRQFTLQKEYWTTTDPKKPMTDFGILYSDCSIEKNLNEEKVSNLGDDKYYKAKLGRLYLKFSKKVIDSDESKDELRKGAIKILSVYLSEKYSMNDEGLKVQEEALKTLEYVMKGNKNPDIEARVISLLRTIINVKILNSLLIKSDSIRAINEKRMTVHKAAVEALERIVAERVKMNRIDSTILQFLKSAILAVRSAKTDKSASACKTIQDTAKKMIEISRMEKTKKLLSNDAYALVQRQSEELEPLFIDSNEEVGYIDYIRGFLAEKDVKIEHYEKKMASKKNAKEKVCRIPFITQDKGDSDNPYWIELEYDPARNMYTWYRENGEVGKESADLKDFKVCSPKDYNFEVLKEVCNVYDKKTEIIAVSSRTEALKEYPQSQNESISFMYGKLSAIRSNLKTKTIDCVLTLPKEMDPKSIKSEIKGVYIFASAPLHGFPRITLRGPEAKMASVLEEVEEQIRHTVEKLQQENPKKRYVVPEPQKVEDRPNEYFLVKAMSELKALTEMRTFDKNVTDVNEDKYFQVEIIRAINSLLSQAQDVKTIVNFVLETSGQNLWGPAMEHVILEKMAKCFYKDILNSVGRALLNIHKIQKGEAGDIQLDDYTKGTPRISLDNLLLDVRELD